MPVLLLLLPSLPLYMHTCAYMHTYMHASMDACKHTYSVRTYMPAYISLSSLHELCIQSLDILIVFWLQVPSQGKNWETPDGIDFDALIADVKEVVDILARADTARQPSQRILSQGALARGSRQSSSTRLVTVHNARSLIEDAVFSLRNCGVSG